MPVTPTYPGVYIEEIPSGVRTITGVATSITAFIGRAPRGPVDEPTTVYSYGDYQRAFGGLTVGYPLSYSVRDFFANGGGEAIIVRLFAAEEGAVKKMPLTLGAVKLEAAYEGKWGVGLRATVNPEEMEINEEIANSLGLETTDLFNLVVSHPELGATETYSNLTFKDSPRRVDLVLAQGSSLVRWVGAVDGDIEGAVPSADTTLQDPLSAQEKEIEAKVKDVKEAKVAFADLPSDASADDITAAEMAVSDAVDAETTAINALKVLKEAAAVVDSKPLSAKNYEGEEADKTGMYALEKAALFNLLCIPPDTRSGDTKIPVYSAAMGYCAKKRAMLIVDSPAAWEATKEKAAADAKKGLSDLGLTGPAARNAALYFPRIKQADPNRDGQIDTFAPSGAIAGIMARTDVSRGVWKAPAGLDASINGIQGLSVNLTDPENGALNPLGINCLRSFPVTGRVVWGARTLRGADVLGDEYKYVPVRRLALFIEETLYRSTQWVVFEPNDEPLWAQIRLNVGTFMHDLFRQGAFQGSSPKDAYLVKCDKETTTQSDIDKGIVNIVVGFAPLKPAEFVIIKLQQLTGGLDV